MTQVQETQDNGVPSRPPRPPYLLIMLLVLAALALMAVARWMRGTAAEAFPRGSGRLEFNLVE